MKILAMLEAQDLRDDEGRLIREGRTPPALIRPGEIEYKPCPYSGSRHQHRNPMNVSALRPISAHWDDILDATAACRSLYGPGVELMDLWRVAQLGSALPWFSILRGQTAPAYAAGLAKITLGVGLWAQRVLVDQLAGRAQPVAYTAASIYASTDGNGTLIGDTEVCTGPEKMMVRYFECLVGAADTSGTAPIRNELAAFHGFAAHYANFKLLLWIHALARRFLYADLIAALPDHPVTPQLRELMTVAEPPDFVHVGPPDHAAVPPPQRALWIAQLAQLVRPMAPDGSDAALQAAAMGIGLVLGTPAGDTPVVRARAAFGRLDALLGQIAAAVEVGLGGGAAAWSEAERDRLLVAPPRALFAQLGI